MNGIGPITDTPCAMIIVTSCRMDRLDQAVHVCCRGFIGRQKFIRHGCEGYWYVSLFTDASTVDYVYFASDNAYDK